MADYQVRFDRLEARMPATGPEPILLLVHPGETKEQVTQAYAAAHGLELSDLWDRAHYVVFVRT
jgi:hypothetical protein